LPDPLPQNKPESGLLSVSKFIRRITMPIYYLGREFEFRVKTDEVSKLYLWVKSVSEQLEGQWPKFTLSLTVSSWKDMVAARSLAALAHSTNFKLAVDMCRPDILNTSHPDQVHSAAHWTSVPDKVRTALQDVAMLGARTRSTSASSGQIEAGFCYWVLANVREVCNGNMSNSRELVESALKTAKLQDGEQVVWREEMVVVLRALVESDSELQLVTQAGEED